MTETLVERLTRTPEGMRLYQQERAIQEITELICEVMEEEPISRSELAKRLGKSKGYITQLLDGRSNMTVRTISDVFTALRRAVHFQEGPLVAAACLRPLSIEVHWPASPHRWVPNLKCSPQLLPGSFGHQMAS